MDDVIFLVLVVAIVYWIIPAVLIILAISRFRARRSHAITLLIISAAMILIGIGICGGKI